MFGYYYCRKYSMAGFKLSVGKSLPWMNFQFALGDSLLDSSISSRLFVSAVIVFLILSPLFLIIESNPVLKREEDRPLADFLS